MRGWGSLDVQRISFFEGRSDIVKNVRRAISCHKFCRRVVVCIAAFCGDALKIYGRNAWNEPRDGDAAWVFVYSICDLVDGRGGI